MFINESGRIGIGSENTHTFVDYFILTPLDPNIQAEYQEEYLVWQEYPKETRHLISDSLHQSSVFWQVAMPYITGTLLPQTTSLFEQCRNSMERDNLVYRYFANFGAIHVVNDRNKDTEHHCKLANKGFLCHQRIVRQPADKEDAAPKPIGYGHAPESKCRIL